jgi:hypothetical protein
MGRCARGRPGHRAAALLALFLSSPVAARTDGEDYPADITPPPGTQYPCALTALPRGLPGIPEADRAYINRTYALILRATQAKLVVLKALERKEDLAGALARYEAIMRSLEERLRSDTPPGGLGAFQEDVQAAFALQRAFFAKAAESIYHHLCALDLF